MSEGKHGECRDFIFEGQCGASVKILKNDTIHNKFQEIMQPVFDTNRVRVSSVM